MSNKALDSLGRTEKQHAALVRAYDKAIEALKSRTITIKVGALWEGPTWDIVTNMVSEASCPHSRPFRPRPGWNYPSGKSWDDPRFVCPRVVVAYNEGGCCETVTCLDCILEHAPAKGERRR